MSFWNVVKSVANSAKCMSGWHAGEYNHTCGKPKCHLEKTCPDCGKYVTKIKHKFGKWRYTNNNINSPCDSIRDCEYCDHQENKVIHKYAKNGKDSNCRIIEKCKNCDSRKLGAESHDWINLLGRDIKIQGKRKCKSCGKIES